jgi:hypothetical protein
MGYTTEFSGAFLLDRPADNETYELLRGLATTRRVARRLGSEHGVDGEFYVGRDDSTIHDYNKPPSTQPGLWCHWLLDAEDRRSIHWNGSEKFHSYVPWLKYIVNRVLVPRGYVLEGRVEWQGEDPKDRGEIRVEGNRVFVCTP